MTRKAIPAIAAVLVALVLAAPAHADPRTQLEMQIGLTVAEAGRYSAVELALMKFYLDDPKLTDQQKRRAVDRVRKGAVPVFQLSF